LGLSPQNSFKYGLTVVQHKFWNTSQNFI